MGYDSATNTATFLMLDGLPVGPSVLRVSGANGVTDLFGNPLAGNPTGDYVVPFTVGGPVRGTGGAKPLVWYDAGPANTTQGTAQVLGPLFPLELQTNKSLAGGVTIRRDFSTDPASAADTNDYFQFQLLQSTRVYGFNLTNLASGQVTLIDSLGHVFTSLDSIPPTLDPGTYWLHVTGWPTNKNSGTYSVQITLGQSGDNPPPLTAGAAPAVRAYLVPAPLITPPPPPPPITPPPSLPPGGNGGSPPNPGPGPTGNGTNSTPTNTPGPINVVVQVTSGTPTGTTPMTPTAGSPVNPNPAEVVVPALLRLASGDASGIAGLPGGSLIVLSTGPLGGVYDAGSSGAASPVKRLSLPGDDQHTDTTTSPTLFVQSGLFGGDDGAIFIDWEPLLQGYRRLLNNLWKTSVEEVPADEGGDVMLPADQEGTDDPFAVAAGTDGASAAGEDSTEADVWETAVAYAPSDATWRSLSANHLLIPGLFVLGSLGMQSRDDRRGPRSAVRGPWSSAKDMDTGH
jgi:hypothetical protein